MKTSIQEIYDQREVFPRFFYRYYEKTNYSDKIFQREIYSEFEKFCKEKTLPLVPPHSLGRYLLRVDGLVYHRSSGNQRVWFGLKRRPEPVTGSITPIDLEAWQAQLVPKFEDGDEDPESLDVHRGRPFRGEAPPLPKRPLKSFVKGYRWGKLYRLYRELDVFESFKQKYVVDNPDWAIPREDVWQAFDDFCRAQNLPTCSAIQLRKGLRVKERTNLDGTREFIGVELRVKNN